MLQIEMLDKGKKVHGIIIASVDFSNPEEIKNVIKSIRDQHQTVMDKQPKEDILNKTQ